MNNILIRNESEIASVVPARGGARDWQRWAPYAAVAWSLAYAALGIYWALGGRGFPYAPQTVPDALGPFAGRFGPGVAWTIVMMAGIPAAAVGAAMLRGVRGRALRPVLIIVGALLGGVLLLLMIEFNLLAQLAYIPFVVFNLLIGAEFGQVFLESLIQSKWTIAHELLCLAGGFLWLAATLSYARRSVGACLYCGRREGCEGWNSPNNAARWGRIAVYVAMVVPVLYALTRYAWALGIPLGMTEEYWRQGQARGEWISGLFLANFALVGAVLMLGLVQRWGEVLPRWMVGLSGRRVPIALAVVPASIMSVLFMVGGIAMWSSFKQMVVWAEATEQNIWIIVGPVLLFPIWAVALAVATLGYYYRRRGPCNVCGRGVSSEFKTDSVPIVKKHPLLAYAALTFAISWGGILLLAGRGEFTVNGEQSERLFLLMYLAMLVGPSLTGILLTRVVYGKEGMREFTSRLLRWQVGARWYAVAILIAPLVFVAVLLALAQISPQFLPRLYISDDKGFLLQFSFMAALMVGVFEEIGWTGFAVQTMLKRGYDILSTGLIVGLLFGAWHLPIVFLMSGTPSGAGELSLIIFLPVSLFTWLPTYRVLMVWVYDRTGSLFLAILMHTSLIAFWTMLTPLTISGLTLVTFYLILSAAMWIIIAVVLKWQTLPRLQHR